MSTRAPGAARRISFVVPSVEGARTYRRRWLRSDALAALSLWALLVPQALAYAELAGLPAVVGLYTALAGMVGYAVMGTTRCLTVGPESTIALIVAGSVGPLAVGDGDRYLALASLLALLTGGLLFLGAALHAGAVLRLLSAPALMGYLAGAGLVIMLSQLGKVLGITVAGTYPTVLGGLMRELDQLNVIALALALGTIAVVVLLRSVAPFLPGGLLAIVGATAIVWTMDLADEVQVVGAIEGGLPSPGLGSITLADVTELLPTALSVALFVFASSALTAKALDPDAGDLDTGREFVALGTANVASGLFGGFPANSSDTRSFLLAQTGGKTQLANLLAGGLVLITLLWLTPLFETLPTAALGGVIVLTAVKLVDIAGLRRLYRIRSMDFMLAGVTLLGVLLTGPIAGIGIGVIASLLDTVRRTAMPRTSVLGRLPDNLGWRDLEQHPDSVTVPGVLVYRFDAPLFFANADLFRTEVLGLVAGADRRVHAVVVNAEGMNDLDVTGAESLARLLKELHADGVRLSLARVRAPVRRLLDATGLTEQLGGDAMYFRVEDAVTAAGLPPTDPSTAVSRGRPDRSG